MHVYIDESGNFISTPHSRVSCVAALAIPSARKDALFAAFARRRQQFSAGVDELKGSTLTEKQIAGVISLLLVHGALLEVCAIDMGIQAEAMTEGFKVKQADKILEHVTPKHHPSVVAELEALRTQMLALPNQLFLQVILTVGLTRRSLETFINYHAQRTPNELADFFWTIDAKASSLTPSEKLWSSLVLPMLHEGDLGMFGWADYSHMDRYVMEVPHVIAGRPASQGFDLRAIVKRNMRFADSRQEVGLQLVDIVANAFTRALNGRLAEEGWRQLGKLFVRRAEQTIHLVSLPSSAMHSAGAYHPPFAGTFRAMEKCAVPMLQIPKGYNGI
jgi:hypothetical protein